MVLESPWRACEKCSFLGHYYKFLESEFLGWELGSWLLVKMILGTLGLKNKAFEISGRGWGMRNKQLLINQILWLGPLFGQLFDKKVYQNWQENLVQL